MYGSIDWEMIALQFMEEYDSDKVDCNAPAEKDFIVNAIRHAYPTLDVFFKRKVELCVAHVFARHTQTMPGVEELLAGVAHALDTIDVWDGFYEPASRGPQTFNAAPEAVFQKPKKPSRRELPDDLRWSSPNTVFMMGQRYENSLHKKQFDVASPSDVSAFIRIVHEFCPTRYIVFWKKLDLAIKKVKDARAGARPFPETVQQIADAMKTISMEEAMAPFHNAARAGGKEEVRMLVGNVIETGRRIETPGEKPGMAVQEYLHASGQLTTRLAEECMKGATAYVDDFREILDADVKEEEQQYVKPAADVVKGLAETVLSRHVHREAGKESAHDTPETGGEPWKPPYGMGAILPDDMPGWNRVYKHMEELGASYRWVKKEPDIRDRIWKHWVSELDPGDPLYAEKLEALRKEFDARFNPPAIMM